MATISYGVTTNSQSRMQDVTASSFSDSALAGRLLKCTDLPSPPTIAEHILRLGQDPSATMNQVAKVVSLDPAIAAKLMRLANSPLYARRRKAGNLRQAITLFGLNGTLTLALSFSLVHTLRQKKHKQLDLSHFWKRSITVASCCQALGEHLNVTTQEDLFLAGLLQDIGMLVLDKAMPELYNDIGKLQFNHHELQQYERNTLGFDHACAGAWLITRWNLPQEIAAMVAHSHEAPQGLNKEQQHNISIGILASSMADLLLNPESSDQLDMLAGAARHSVGLATEDISSVLENVRAGVEENAQLFKVDLGDTAFMDSLVEQAKETLMLRNLQMIGETAELQESRNTLELRTRELEETSRRDRLTGLFNRAYFDKMLIEEFDNAVRQGWPLAIAFIDLDHFKHVNDTYGHQAGDIVLERTGQLLAANSRSNDIIARYGGEEFIAILPGTGIEGARIMSDRVLESFRITTHQINDTEKPIVVTASIGIAAYTRNNRFADHNALLRAADEAVYKAKQSGRNQAFFHPEGVKSSNI